LIEDRPSLSASGEIGSCRPASLPVLFELLHIYANTLAIGQLAPPRFIPAVLNLGRNGSVVIGQPVLFGAQRFKCTLDDMSASISGHSSTVMTSRYARNRLVTRLLTEKMKRGAKRFVF